MGLFDRLRSAFTASVENAISELSKNTNNANNTNKVETNQPTVENKTITPDNNSNDMIRPYVFNGEVKSGTQIMVSSDEAIVVMKNGVVVNFLLPGVYVFNDSNADDFVTGSAYTISLKESEEIRWGTAKPICFTDSEYGMLSLRVCGAFSYTICDPVKFVIDYMNTGSSVSVNEYTKNLLINTLDETFSKYNGTSYTILPLAEICKHIENELQTKGINIKVKIKMIKLTEDSQAIINQAMQNKILNNQ